MRLDMPRGIPKAALCSRRRSALRDLCALTILLGCLPSLLFNVGVARGLLIHDHYEESFHGHVVTIAQRGDHPHSHAHVHPHHHRGERPPEDTPADGEDGHGDTFVRGTELGLLKKQAAPERVCHLAPSLAESSPRVSALSAPSAPQKGRTTRGGEARGVDLACLRATILLV